MQRSRIPLFVLLALFATPFASAESDADRFYEMFTQFRSRSIPSLPGSERFTRDRNRIEAFTPADAGGEVSVSILGPRLFPQAAGRRSCISGDYSQGTIVWAGVTIPVIKYVQQNSEPLFWRFNATGSQATSLAFENAVYEPAPIAIKPLQK